MKSHTYVHKHILTGVNEPQKFFSEFEVPCPSGKLFHLKQFAIYGMCRQKCTVAACLVAFDGLTQSATADGHHVLQVVLYPGPGLCVHHP